MVVLSPHLDDAVFSCGQLLAGHPGSTVITVFAGLPLRSEQQTEWDARCGFANAEQAMARRRYEDEQAMALLQARPTWLHFADSQYGETPTVVHVADVLRQVLGVLAARQVLLPLGLFHSDHLLVHDAGRQALHALGNEDWLAYEDAPYRGMPGVLQQRLAEMARAGVRATPARLPVGGAPEAKARAVQAYASQLRGFGPGGHDDLAWPERYWRLETVGDGKADAA